MKKIFLIILLANATNIVAQTAKPAVIEREGRAEFTISKGVHKAKLILETRLFDRSRHRIVHLKNCVTIDGRLPLGTDCGVPEVEIASMRLFIDGKAIV